MKLACYERQGHRDIDPPPWAHVVVYRSATQALQRVLAATQPP